MARPGGQDAGQQLLGLGAGQQQAHGQDRHAQPARGSHRVVDEQLGASHQQAGGQQQAGPRAALPKHAHRSPSRISVAGL